MSHGYPEIYAGTEIPKSRKVLPGGKTVFAEHPAACSAHTVKRMARSGKASGHGACAVWSAASRLRDPLGPHTPGGGVRYGYGSPTAAQHDGTIIGRIVEKKTRSLHGDVLRVQPLPCGLRVSPFKEKGQASGAASARTATATTTTKQATRPNTLVRETP